jgi:hypothetical protein
VLPSNLNTKRPSLLALKQGEFKDRKRLLNPYQKEVMLRERTPQEIKILKELEQRTSHQSMQTFTITYDRHKGKYGHRTSNFPEMYDHSASRLEIANDPDWVVKMGVSRFPMRKYVCAGIVLMLLYR